MGLFDKFFNTKRSYESKKSETPKATAPKASTPIQREPTPNEIAHNHFQTAMHTEDPIQRRKEIEAITDQYWLSRLAREGKYENDRIQALNQLSDQNILLEIASEEGNIPRIQSLAQDKLDDAHRFLLIKKVYISDADKCRATAKISDLEILHEILLYAGGGRLVQLAAARRLELIAPDVAKQSEEVINYLRRKF